MIALTIILTICAAGLFATSTVLQRYAAGQAEKEDLFRRDLVRNLTKNYKWIIAFGLEVVAFVFQAAALRKGSLLLVEPLMTVDLVFLMAILHFYKKLPIGKREWLAIFMIISGLSGMLISADPHVGHKQYVIPRLVLVSSSIAIIICLGIFIVRRTKNTNYRAAVSAFAAGFSFALVAVFTKIVILELHRGPVFVLTHWQVWGLLITGIVSVIMTQNTFSAGPVAVSQPIMEIVEPLVSIVLGIYLFGDTVNLDTTSLFFAVTMGVIAGGGITILARSKRLEVLEV